MLACRFNDPIKTTHHHTAGCLRANTHTGTQTNACACGLAATLARHRSERALDKKRREGSLGTHIHPTAALFFGYTLGAGLNCTSVPEGGHLICIWLVFIESRRGQNRGEEASRYSKPHLRDGF